MRIHQYIFGKDGGAEKFFVHLSSALAKRGVEQTVVMRWNRRWKPDVEKHATIIQSNFRDASIDRLLLPIKVRKLAEKEQPNAILTWSTRGARLMPAYKGGIKLSRLGDYPTHLGYFKNSDVLVCNTPGIADHVRNNLGWTRGVEVISNFTDTAPVAPVSRAVANTPEGVPLIMTMARFVKRKRIHLLIEAMAAVPDAFLWIAGEGEEKDALEAEVRDRKLEHRVRFLGWQKDARPYVAAADIFVMPSSHEPLGNVIFEAWAQGVPVVSSRSEGPSWFMQDGENGLMVDIDDVAGYARAINQLIADKQLAKSIGVKGQATLVGQFSEEAVCNAYVELFKRKP